MPNYEFYIIPALFVGMVVIFLMYLKQRYYAGEYQEKYEETLKSYERMRTYFLRNEQAKQDEIECNKLTIKRSNERFAEAQAKGYKYNHLVKGIENNELNRNMVANINKEMKRSESKWRFRIKYRKPKDGWGANQAHVRQEDALEFSIYLRDKTYE